MITPAATYHLTRAHGWRTIREEMHMIDHYLQGQRLTVQFAQHSLDHWLHPCLDRASKHLLSVLRGRDEVVVGQRN